MYVRSSPVWFPYCVMFDCTVDSAICSPPLPKVLKKPKYHMYIGKLKMVGKTY